MAVGEKISSQDKTNLKECRNYAAKYETPRHALISWSAFLLWIREVKRLFFIIQFNVSHVTDDTVNSCTRFVIFLGIRGKALYQKIAY